jgi:hypothetical protein
MKPQRKTQRYPLRPLVLEPKLESHEEVKTHPLGWFLSVGISWEYHGNTMGMSSGYHGNIMGVSWENHGGIMGKPWEYLAKLMETSCENHGKFMAI